MILPPNLIPIECPAHVARVDLDGRCGEPGFELVEAGEDLGDGAHYIPQIGRKTPVEKQGFLYGLTPAACTNR
jgi:hypothetical protein